MKSRVNTPPEVMDAVTTRKDMSQWDAVTGGFLSASELVESTMTSMIEASPKEDGLTKVVMFLDKYYLPALVVLGTLGNMLSFAVFLSAYLRQLSLSVYLSALAFSDSVFLFSLGMGWMPLFHQPGWCQLTIYLSYVSSFLSSWFVVSFTVERYIAICYPLRRPEMCTTSRAKLVVGSLTIFGVLAYACSTWTTGTQEVNNSTVCMPLEQFYNIHLITTYVDLVISLIIPFTAILFLNIKIAYTLRTFSKRNEKTRDCARVGTWNRTQLQMNHLGNRAQVNVTKLLLIISTVFLVINLPSYVMRLRMFVITFKFHKQTSTDGRIQQLVQFIYYLNFGINFYLYSLWSRRFRQGMARLLWQARYHLRNLVEKSYRLFRGSSVQTTQVDLGGIVLQDQALCSPIAPCPPNDKDKKTRSSSNTGSEKSKNRHSSSSGRNKAMYSGLA